MTINTTSANYSTTNLSYTYDDVTVAFSNLSSVSGDYVTVAGGSTVTVSVPSGYHISGMDFTYYSGWTTTYDPASVSATSGTYNNGTWTAANSTTTNVRFTMTRGTGWNAHDIRIESIVVTVVED